MDYAASILARLPNRKRAIGLDGLVKKLQGYLPDDQVAQVLDAYHFAEEAHQGQKRKTGEPYISHPVAVAGLLAELNLDSQTLMAALLHDVIEDTGIDKTDLGERFGEEVAELVDGVSKLDQIKFRSREEAQAESFRKMLLAMVGDIRVILVKLADRTHNMRTLWVMPADKRRRIARETLDIYAPIANRLGMNTLRLELEDLGFRALFPYRYRVLERSPGPGEDQETLHPDPEGGRGQRLRRRSGEASLQHLSEDAREEALAGGDRGRLWPADRCRVG
jgi:guanosine-3',5'-bis(diphosphate) 3'-pyrophosphohydrolase